MSYSVSIADIRGRVARIHDLLTEHPEVAQKLGMDEGWTLQFDEGSKTYGRAYRLHYSPEGSTAHYRIHASVSSPDYLGMTKAEAFDTLGDFMREIYLMAELLAK